MINRARHHHHGLARALRLKPTEAEKLLWKELRNRKLSGYRFRRQHTIGPFIADFCCVEARLVVELDGDRHVWRRRRDIRRTGRLKPAGYRVMRFWDREVLDNLPRILRRILQELDRSRRID